MEIPAWLFFSFRAVISITFLHVGFYALDKSELSNSVSPVIMSFFKHTVAFSSSCSSHYALIFRPLSRYHVHGFYFWIASVTIPVLIYNTFCEINAYTILSLFLSYVAIEYVWLDQLPLRMVFRRIYTWIRTIILLPTALFPSYFLFVVSINFILVSIRYRLTLGQKTSIGIHMAAVTSLFFISREKAKFSPVVVLLLSFLVSAFWAALSRFEPRIAMKVREIFSKSEEKKIMGKWIEFAVGMAGALLFQNFFRLTSFNEVAAFLYLAAMWVANLALLGVSGDFGVLSFLLGNVVVGCTVNQLGLRSTTWLAYGASVLLFGLRLKLESLNLVYQRGEQIQVNLCSKSSPNLPPI